MGLGLDVNAKDSNGFTALHWAADQGHTEVVEYLGGWVVLPLQAILGAKNRLGGLAHPRFWSLGAVSSQNRADTGRPGGSEARSCGGAGFRRFCENLVSVGFVSFTELLVEGTTHREQMFAVVAVRGEGTGGCGWARWARCRRAMDTAANSTHRSARMVTVVTARAWAMAAVNWPVRRRTWARYRRYVALRQRVSKIELFNPRRKADAMLDGRTTRAL